MLVNSELLLQLTHFLLLMMLLFMEQSTVIEMLTSVVGPGPNHCQVECYNRGGCERKRRRGGGGVGGGDELPLLLCPTNTSL